MKNYWLQLSRRAKESEKIRFNYLMQKIAEGGGGGGGSEWAERIAAIEEKIFLIRQDITSLTGRITNAEAKNTEQDTNISSIEEKEDLLELKVALYSGKVDDLVTKVNDHEGLISSLLGSVTSLTSKIEEFEDKITTFTEKITTFEGKISDFEVEIGTWSSRITTIEGKIAEFEGKITSFTQRLDDLERLVNTFDGKITSLTSTVTEFTTTFQDKISTLTTQVTEMGSTVETFDNRIIGLNVQVKALEDRFGYTTVVYVWDKESGSRIPGAAVHLSGHILTDDGEGKYEIVDLPPASYLLTVNADGYTPYSEEITVNKQHCDFDVNLDKCYKIYGVVKNTRDDPVRNAMVLPMEKSERVTYTDGEGRYEITELENGEYTIMTQKEGYATATDYVTIFNEDAELDIFLVED